MGEAARKQGSEEDIGNRDVEKKEVHLNWKKIALIGTVPILLIFLGFFLVLKFIGGENYSLAVDWFDERFGVRFSTYAVPMIAGEIKRFLRDDGSVKVSRVLKKQARELNDYIERKETEEGVQPTVKELAAAFGMEEGEVVFALGASRMPLSLDESGEYKDEKSVPLSERIPAKDDQDEMIERMILKEAIGKLPEREKKIVFLRYFRDMTQSEVAQRIGVSQVQISRIESKIMGKFKEELQPK